RSQTVCFQLVFAAIAPNQLGAVHAGGVHDVAAASEHAGRDREHRCGNGAGALAGGVAGGNVGDFVPEYPGQLGLRAQVGQQAAVDVHIATGGGKGVDVGAVDHGKGEIDLR